LTTTVVYITNISDQEAQFVGEVNYEGGKVAIDPRKLRPHETAVFDLQQFSDSQVADGLGNKLPRGATIGQFKWSIFGVTNGKLLLIGRAEMVSRSEHISSSYSCNDPCPPYIVGSIDPLEPYIIVSDSANTSAWQRAYYDNGYSMGPYSVGADWSVDTSAASLDPSSSHTTTITGEDAEIGGDVNIIADMGWQERYSWDGLNCYDNNYADPVGDSTSVSIAGVSWATMQEGPEYADGTADFYVIDPCNVTCKPSGFVRLHRTCNVNTLEYKSRLEAWYKPAYPIPLKVCLGYHEHGAITYYNYCNGSPGDCYEEILHP
jgi:hypothetical protein